MYDVGLRGFFQNLSSARDNVCFPYIQTALLKLMCNSFRARL